MSAVSICPLFDERLMLLRFLCDGVSTCEGVPTDEARAAAIFVFEVRWRGDLRDGTWDSVGVGTVQDDNGPATTPFTVVPLDVLLGRWLAGTPPFVRGTSTMESSCNVRNQNTCNSSATDDHYTVKLMVRRVRRVCVVCV